MTKHKTNPPTDMDTDEDILSLSTPSHDEKAPIHAHPAYKALEEKVQTLEIQLQTAHTALEEQKLRDHAELENVRKRAHKDVQNAHKYGAERLLTELIPVIDSLENGIAIAVGDNAFAQQIHTGVEMTLKLLMDTLEKHHIQAIHPLGEAFDPTLHQAISMREEAGMQTNTVLEVLQKGYQLHDRLIRPALVIVAK
jgi:molecular chaperone GrpE